MFIDIAKIIPVSEVNGPGKRAVVWVQGCPKRCLGCWNPEFLPFRSAWRLTPDELVKAIADQTAGFSQIEGVTFSGGEPFAQAEALSKAASELKKHDLGIMSYSGYTIEEILNFGAIHQKFLQILDILVDGEFLRELTVDRMWRSSSNQKVHFLTNRYEGWKAQVNNSVREFEVTVSGDIVNMTGFPILNNFRK